MKRSLKRAFRSVSYMIRALQRRRGIGVAAGVFLIAVPTLFEVFPGFGQWPLWVRILVAVCWALVAGAVVWGAVLQSERMEDFVGSARARRDEQRLMATARITPLLLAHDTGIPDGYRFRIYVYDENSNRLVVSYDPHRTEDATAWEPGKGAVGVAYESNERVIVRGEKVSDSTFGLTAAQQARNKDLQVVAAHPLRNDRGQAIGVLSASSTTDDGTFGMPHVLNAFAALAIIISRVVIDLRTQPD